MLNFNLFENIDLNFFCFGAEKNKNKKKKKLKIDDEDLDRSIYHVSKKYKISILPITPNFDIDNLYPLTDHVELWNIFIIGNDKTYILANVNDPHIYIPQADQLPNRQGQNLLSDELVIVFDGIWTKTLQGKQLQFYMVWNSKLYFINTYPFFNGKGKVIGAILFMRAFETMPETKFTVLENQMPVKYSLDIKREPGFSTENKRSPHSTERILNQVKEDFNVFFNLNPPVSGMPETIS